MSSGSVSSGASGRSVPASDAVTKNALRYTLSRSEYELLHKYLLSRAPVVRKRAPPPPPRQDPAVEHDEDFHAATVRLSLRLFLTSYSGLKAWELISQKVLKRPATAFV